MDHTTYSDARANLASLLDRAEADREPIIIRRRGHQDVALIAAEELRGLLETAHLLSSRANTKRLLAAMRRARSRKGLVKSSLSELQLLARGTQTPAKPRRKAR